MTALVKSELDRIVSVFVETGLVTKIILFGSCARGDVTPDSDIDLCVLTPVEEDEEGLSVTKVGASLRVKSVNVRERDLDLLAYNQNDFQTLAALPRSFERHIAEKGVVLYELCT